MARLRRQSPGAWIRRPAASVARRALADIPIHLSFSPDGKLLALGLAERGTELRDSRSLRIVARLARGPETGSLGALLAGRRATGRQLVEGSTQLWDVATRRRIGVPLRGHEFDVLNAEFSPDGRQLATSGIDGTAILWDVKSRRALGTLPGPFGRASVRFTPDGRRLFLLRDSGAAQRWEVDPERLVATGLPRGGSRTDACRVGRVRP